MPLDPLLHLIDPAAVREHIAELKNAGVGLRTIALCADLPRATLWRLVRGKLAALDPIAARRILAVRPEDAPDGALIDATPARELLARMVHAGYSPASVDTAIGMPMATVLIRQSITVGLARHLQRAYWRSWTQCERLRELDPVGVRPPPTFEETPLKHYAEPKWLTMPVDEFLRGILRLVSPLAIAEMRERAGWEQRNERWLSA